MAVTSSDAGMVRTTGRGGSVRQGMQMRGSNAGAISTGNPMFKASPMGIFKQSNPMRVNKNMPRNR